MKGWWVPQPHLYYFHYNSLPFSLMKSSFIFFSLISFSLWLSSHTYTFLTCMSTNLRCISKKKKNTWSQVPTIVPGISVFFSLIYLFILLNLWKGIFIFNWWCFNQVFFYNYFLCWIIVRWSYCWEKKGNRANFFEISASGWEKKG